VFTEKDTAITQAGSLSLKYLLQRRWLGDLKSLYKMKSAYEVQKPDFSLSPFAGMRKKHYIECAKYLLTRAFKRHVDSVDKPLHL
jgi:hypothetical protein